MGLMGKLLTPAAHAWYMLRYRSIWRLRGKMREKCVKGDKVDCNKMICRAYMHYFDKQGSFVGPLAEFAGEPCFPHGPVGVFISNDAKIGRDAVIFQQVTVGSNNLADAKNPGAPTLGDRVYIGAGAKVIGGITVGDGCRIGAGAVVYADMPENSVAVCAPTRIIERDAPMDNRHFQKTDDGGRRYFEDGRWHSEK